MGKTVSNRPKARAVALAALIASGALTSCNTPKAQGSSPDEVSTTSSVPASTLITTTTMVEPQIKIDKGNWVKQPDYSDSQLLIDDYEIDLETFNYVKNLGDQFVERINSYLSNGYLELTEKVGRDGIKYMRGEATFKTGDLELVVTSDNMVEVRKGVWEFDGLLVAFIKAPTDLLIEIRPDAVFTQDRKQNGTASSMTQYYVGKKRDGSEYTSISGSSSVDSTRGIKPDYSKDFDNLTSFMNRFIEIVGVSPILNNDTPIRLFPR